MINEQKILDYLMNDLKRPLVEVRPDHTIICKSPITHLNKLCELVEPLHYYVSYNVGAIYIIPKI